LPLLIEFIAIGLVSSLLLAEFFGLSAAGLIVPGYIAYHIKEPFFLFIIIAATLLTYSTERLVASFTILFGRRLLSVDVLTSFIWVYFLEKTFLWIGVPVSILVDPIAYFIPALIVIFIGSSGFKSTFLAIALNTILVFFIFHLSSFIEKFLSLGGIL
jgi:gamma-polyglutamate biosynthesis protein CapC